MTKMKLLNKKNTDLSHIKNINELDAEIVRVKQRVRAGENILKNNAKKIPVEAVKVTLGAIIPTFAKANRADEAFKAVQTLAGGIAASFFNAKRNGTSFKQGVADTVKQIGFFGIAQAVIQLIGIGKNKKASSFKKNKDASAKIAAN